MYYQKCLCRELLRISSLLEFRSCVFELRFSLMQLKQCLFFVHKFWKVSAPSTSINLQTSFTHRNYHGSHYLHVTLRWKLLCASSNAPRLICKHHLHVETITHLHIETITHLLGKLLLTCHFTYGNDHLNQVTHLV